MSKTVSVIKNVGNTGVSGKGATHVEQNKDIAVENITATIQQDKDTSIVLDLRDISSKPTTTNSNSNGSGNGNGNGNGYGYGNGNGNGNGRNDLTGNFLDDG